MVRTPLAFLLLLAAPGCRGPDTGESRSPAPPSIGAPAVDAVPTDLSRIEAAARTPLAGCAAAPASAAGSPLEAVAEGMLAEYEEGGTCPVRLGEVVDGRTFVEWNGLRFGLCCRECVPRFLESPALCLDSARFDWRAAAALERAAGDAKIQEDRERFLDDLRVSGWKVVREPPPLPRTGLLVDLANDNCPVDFEEPDGKSYVEWNGLRVGLCCARCSSHFWGHPALVLEHAGIEWKDAADAARKVNGAATAADRDRALEELGARWKVIRDDRDPAPGKGR